MNELLDIVSKLGRSRPIFNLSLNSDVKHLNLDASSTIYKYSPPNSDNALVQLVAHHYSEHFNTDIRDFSVNSQQIIDNVMHHIREYVSDFIYYNRNIKKTTSNKLYTWSRNMPTDDEFNDTLVMMYKYISSIEEDDKVKIANALALLEVMQGKYGKQ